MKKLFLFSFIVFSFFSCAGKPVYPEASPDGKEVRISLADIGDKRPVFRTFYSEGRKINFFIVKTGDGVSSYFDACAKCNPKKLGYRPDGDQIVCRACGVRYSVDDLKEGIGSCYPIRLNGKVEGSGYVITVKDLAAGRDYF